MVTNLSIKQSLHLGFTRQPGSPRSIDLPLEVRSQFLAKLILSTDNHIVLDSELAEA